MKTRMSGIGAMVVALSLTGLLAAADVDIDGAVPGKWTMDFDAAKKVAAAKRLPILLDFSGSDWCGWCKLMEKKVFLEKNWHDYATNNIVMVIIDFPQDDTIVPEKYRARNETLKEKYGVEGFPAFIVLDDDAQRVLGKLGAGEDKTPESFIAELQQLFRYRPAEVAKYTQGLSPADKGAYGKITDAMAAARKSIKEQEQQIESAKQKIEELQKQGAELEERAIQFRVSKFGPEKRKEFNELKAKVEQARQKLTDWLKTEPPRNQENTEKFKAMSQEIQQLAGKMQAY